MLMRNLSQYWNLNFKNMMSKMLKRIFDITISLFAIVVLSPLFIFLAYKVKKNLGEPILFRQIRPGLNGKPFEMIKFRTMKDLMGKDGNSLSDEDRLTDFGKKLRSTSLDELPELWNVLKGDMSLVGPRPLLMEYLPLYNDEQAKRHNVKPGITGYAQVNGRNAISWEEKFKLDVWYVENKSFLLDLKILIKTIKKVFFKEDINYKEDATMPIFKGNNYLHDVNVLITSAGQRVSLVKAFQKELKNMNNTGKVFTTDLNPELAPACHVADGYFSVPRATDPNYSQTLLDICIENNIKLVIPTIDTELLGLSKARNDFLNRGIFIIISNQEFIEKCRDKRLTNELFLFHDISIPKQYSRNSLEFPCFVKPFDGSLSKGIFIAYEPKCIDHRHLEDERLMFMEYIFPDEYDEFTVDCYYDRSSNLKCIVPRKRIFVRAGEINKGITCRNKIVSELREKIAFLDGALGCITIQLFCHKITEKILGIEINPRFGGGFPLSYFAGANYPLWIIKEYLFGETISDYDDWDDNLLMLRYDAEVLIKKDER